MADKTDVSKLMMQIETQRERAALARRLARAIASTDPAFGSLNSYAEELEAELEKLEAQVAVLKQAAAQTAEETDPAQPIAALKPPPDPEPET